MIKLNKIVDFLGKFISLFFLLLVLLRCLKVSFYSSCLLSVVITCFLLTLFQMIRRMKNESNKSKEEDAKNVEKITYTSTNAYFISYSPKSIK